MEKVMDNAEVLAERRLWTAVLAHTVQEWVSGPLRKQREAEAYLFSDNEDFPAVCQSAGLDPQEFRARLEKLRRKTNVHNNN